MVKAIEQRKRTGDLDGSQRGELFEVGFVELELPAPVPHVGDLEVGQQVAGEVVHERVAAGEIGNESGVPDRQSHGLGDEARVARARRA